MKPRHWVLIALIGALFGLLVFWVLTFYERVEEQRLVGLRGEAVRNPYLALQRLASGYGWSVTKVKDAEVLNTLPAQATLLLPDRRLALMTRERVEQLLLWVESGGHLLVEAEILRYEDPLLNDIGVARKERDRKKPYRREQFRLPGNDKPLEIDFAPHLELSDESDERDDIALQLPEGSGTRLLQYQIGAGRITVLASFNFFTYRNIGRYDHAEFIWNLIDSPEQKRELWMLTHPLYPSIWQWLWEHAWMVLLSGFALLLLWLWSIVPRFGPLLPEPTLARKSLVEHLTAVGRFSWRSERSVALLRVSREAILRRLAWRRPHIANSPPATRDQAMAKLAACNPQRMTEALQRTPSTPREFIVIIQTLQAVQKQLN